MGECRHKWSIPTTGIGYQCCMKDGCNAERYMNSKSNAQSESLKIVEDLKAENVWPDDMSDSHFEFLAGYIIKDRERICEPLVKLDLKAGTMIELSMLNMNNILLAAQQTLQRAGIDV